MSSKNVRQILQSLRIRHSGSKLQFHEFREIDITDAQVFQTLRNVVQGPEDCTILLEMPAPFAQGPPRIAIQKFFVDGHCGTFALHYSPNSTSLSFCSVLFQMASKYRHSAGVSLLDNHRLVELGRGGRIVQDVALAVVHADVVFQVGLGGFRRQRDLVHTANFMGQRRLGKLAAS